MKSTKLSIVTITYNNYEELVKTLSSTEGIPETERIVINGGKCEKTRSFLKERRDIKSVSERDNGISDAFNKGIKLANSQYVWLLNSGDILLDKNYPTLAMKELQNCDYVYSNIELRFQKEHLLITPTKKKTLAWGMPFPHPSFIAKKSIYDDIGYYDSTFKIAMDLDIICRIKKLNRHKGSYIEMTSVMMDGNGVSNLKPLETSLETLKALRKNHLLHASEILSFARLIVFLLKKNLKEAWKSRTPAN